MLKKDLLNEIDNWVDENIITTDQAEKICQRYNINYQQKVDHSFGYYLLIALGYLFLGLSLITLIGANWDDLSRAGRMWGLIFLTIVVHGVGLYYLNKSNQKVAVLWFFLGNFCYGASIILIAQIYHLGEHMPDGVFWWAIGSLPMALLLGNSWLMFQSLLLGIVWFFLETSMGFYPLLFPVFIASAIYILIRQNQNQLLFITTLGAAVLAIEYSVAFLWSDFRGFNLYPEHYIVSGMLMAGIYFFSQLLERLPVEKYKVYSSLLSVWWLRGVMLAMVIMSFDDPWYDMLSSNWDQLISLAVVLIFMLILNFLMANQLGQIVTYYISSAGLILVTVILVFTANPSMTVYFQVAMNLFIVGLSIWMIIQGIHRNISMLFFSGVALILIIAVIRYFDLIGDYIGGAILFATAAALMIISARYWKKYQLRVKEDA